MNEQLQAGTRIQRVIGWHYDCTVMSGVRPVRRRPGARSFHVCVQVTRSEDESCTLSSCVFAIFQGSSYSAWNFREQQWSSSSMVRSQLATWSTVLLLGCQSFKPAVPTQPARSQAPAVYSSQQPAFQVFPSGASATDGVDKLEQRVIAIATASRSSCALQEDHSVWCWGDDHSHFSDGYEDWVRQIPLPAVSKIVGANQRMFAVTTTGDLYYWGENIGTRPPFGGGATPRRLPLTDVIDVAASWDDLCAIERSGRVTCWYAEGGQTVLASLPAAKGLALSRDETCVLLGSGAVTCFRKQPTAEVRSGLTDAVELAAGGDTHCALRRQGSVSCWPDNDRARSFARSAGNDVRHLSSTPHALCALKSIGLPHCLTLTSGGDSDRPVLTVGQVFPEAAELSDVRFGPSHACAVVRGVAWCWGENEFGDLGQPRAPQGAILLSRVSLGDTAALQHLTRVAVGRNHRCVVVADGTVRCWGDGEWGKLGTADRAAHAGPTRVPGLSRITDVVVSDTATCALSSDQSLYCFGRQPWRADLPPCKQGEDEGGEEAPCSSTPSLVGNGISQVGLGEDHICTLGSDARVRCWGNNQRGQLGTGDTRSRATPAPVLTRDGHELSGVSRLRVFGNHACAVMKSGALQCWGDNGPSVQGRPYNGPPILTYATPVSGVAGVTDVSDQCTLSRSGELRCWGNIFADPRDFSYQPLRVGQCHVRELSAGRGPCFADSSSIDCLGEDGFHAPIALSSLAGSPSELCGIDEHGSLACWNTELLARPKIGTTAAVDVSWLASAEGCAHDPPPRTLPKFPPLPPASVTAHDLKRGAPQAETGLRLSKEQVSNMLTLLNDPQSYVSSVTCHEARHQYVFRDSRGLSQATLGVSADCLTVESEPEIPAQRRVGGNVVAARLTRGLAELCRSLKLDGCPGDDPAVSEPSQHAQD